MKPDRKRMSGFVLLSGCEFSGSRSMVKKGVFVVVAVALFKRVMEQVLSEMTDQEIRHLITEEWRDALISPPVDGKHSFASSRTVRYFYSLSVDIVDKISPALDGGGLDCGVVKGLLFAIGFRSTDYIVDSELLFLAQMLQESRDELFYLSSTDFLYTWYDGEYSSEVIYQFVSQLSHLCENATRIDEV